MQHQPSKKAMDAPLERTQHARVRMLGAFGRMTHALRSILAVPTPILAPSARLLAAAAAATAVYGCVGGSGEQALTSIKAQSMSHQAPTGTPSWEQAGIDYFPHRFPTPQGEIEPLPAQF